MRWMVIGVVGGFGLMAAPGARADEGEDKKEATKEKDEGEGDQEKASVTLHEGTFGGEKIVYSATAGTIVLKKNEETPHASVFYTSYIKAGGGVERPVVFCFNGGPGSSSVWLHLGGLGPKRVVMGPGGTQPAPPYRLEENGESILRVADLVFIDPVSTGFSRAEKGEKASDFHGYSEDLNSVAEFIRLWTTRNERWSSAKFLAGESYGAFRAAGLAGVLQDRYGMYLNGIVLVSGVLDFATLWGTDLAHVCFLPAMANVAKFHGKLSAEVAEADDDLLRRTVAQFAEGEYATALLKGARITAAEKTAVANRLAAFTGLDAGLIERLDLRISPSRFREELLREEGLVIGRFDARLKGEDGDLAGTSPRFDPSHAAVTGAYSAMMKDYVRRVLEFESDLSYEILTGKVRPWNYSAFEGESVKVTPKLAGAMLENPHLKVLVLCGYHDLATPGFAIRQSLDQLGIGATLMGNISYRYYPGGHMMYTIEESNRSMNRDVKAFIEAEKGGD